MALKEVTLKRVIDTSGNTDELFPSTTMAQVRVSTGDATTLTSHLTSTYIPLSQKGANNGVATLSNTGKVPESQLPSSVFGGMRLIDTISSNTTAEALMDLAQTYVASNGGVLEGSYFIIGGNSSVPVVITGGADSNNGVTHTFDAEQTNTVGEENDDDLDGGNVALEPGDWIVMGGQWTLNTTTYQRWGVVNNTYQDANVGVAGIVELSNATSVTGMSGNDVITEGVLAGLVGTASGDLAAGDHLHDGRYYTESEVQNFFDGTTSISGYNKTNWDAAYNDKVNSVGFATGTGVLTLTQQDSGTLTVDLDGRYAEEVTAGGGITVTQTGDSYEVAHTDTSSQASVNFTGGTVIQDLTLDTYGHITGLQGYDLDGRYYTESEFNNWLNGDTAIDGHNFTEIIYGATPSSTNVGTILIDED
jgi:hypothetical protein